MKPKFERESLEELLQNVDGVLRLRMVTPQGRLAEQRWFTVAVTIAVMLVGLVASLVTDSVIVVFIASCPVGLLGFFVFAPLVDRRRARDATRESRNAED